MTTINLATAKPGFMKEARYIPTDDVSYQKVKLSNLYGVKGSTRHISADHLNTWELCYTGTVGDAWLVNLFANEYNCLMKGA